MAVTSFFEITWTSWQRKSTLPLLPVSRKTKTPANGPLVINFTQPPVIQHKEVSLAGISGTRGLPRVSQWWPDVCTKRDGFITY
ncbi:hypothetical protein J6590_082787 [Homalodisca vitripennis]|nr:hypothetical protein J6590_082787 [Homalodisca vitripennis]